MVSWYHQPSGKWIPPFHDFGKPLRKVLAATWRNSSTRHLDSSMRRSRCFFCGFLAFRKGGKDGLDPSMKIFPIFDGQHAGIRCRSSQATWRHEATKTRCDCRDSGEPEKRPPLDGPSPAESPIFLGKFNHDLTVLPHWNHG